MFYAKYLCVAVGKNTHEPGKKKKETKGTDSVGKQMNTIVYQRK